jgi:hypothetical protein
MRCWARRWRTPDVTEKLVAQTLDPMHISPEQFAARLKSDYDKYENCGENQRRTRRLTATPPGARLFGCAP